MHSMQESSGIVTQNLLSARQVQMILHIDRSTVYRMAEDGRLPAVKVGRQWRFPEARIAALAAAATIAPTKAPTTAEATAAGTARGTGGAYAGPDGLVQAEPAVVDIRSAEAPHALSAEVAAPVAQVAADLLGVMMVVTDMDGRPLTGVTNPCPWFLQRSDDAQLLSACTAEWQQMADDPDFEPKFSVGVLGFECARAFIRNGSSLVGMVLAGGIAPPGCDDPSLYQLDAERRRAVLAALPKVAGALSRVAPRTQPSAGPATGPPSHAST